MAKPMQQQLIEITGEKWVMVPSTSRDTLDIDVILSVLIR